MHTRQDSSALRFYLVAVVFLSSLACPRLGTTILGIAPAAAADRVACMETAGDAATACLGRWFETVEACRTAQDAACETAAVGEGGPLAALVAETKTNAPADCDESVAVGLGYQTVADVGARAGDACGDWAAALLDLASSPAAETLSGAALACQRQVAKSVRQLAGTVITAFAERCYLREAREKTCARGKRDTVVKKATKVARRRIKKTCKTDYDALALDPLDALLARATTLARHFAQQVYPPNDLGPTGEIGPYPPAVRTLQFSDPTRQNVAGDGPRPVTVEIYYPTTPEAIVGVPRDVANLLGIDLATLPAWRDVALRSGTYPLVVFSHGNNGTRIQSVFFGLHLASHGFIVASPDHHGNTFPDTLVGVVDPASAANRPRDLSFVIDRLLALNATAGHFLHGTIDPDKIGASGHSFGGFTVFAIAGGPTAIGTFTDSRVKAILPQAPASPFDAAFFASIRIPTLILGGSLDATTPFDTQQQAPFDALPSGAAVVGLANLRDAGHFTFSDFCEVDRALLAFLGGFDEACEPRHLPFRHGHDITNYLSLNFFDAVLNGDADALARLDPRAVGRIEDLTFTRK